MRTAGGLAALVSARLEELGCDPITGMALIALNENEESAIRVRCYSELAQYVYPKRRAVEHSGPGGGPIQVENIDPYDAFARDVTLAAERERAREDHPQADPSPN